MSFVSSLQPRNLTFVCLAGLFLFGCQQHSQETNQNHAQDEAVTPQASDVQSKSESISIAAAANLADVLPDIVQHYCEDKQLSPCPIETSFASSGKLYAQIMAGAPYDVYLAANQSYPEKLLTEMGEKLQGKQTFTYARGQLALYSTVEQLNADGDNLSLLKKPKVKVAIANPELAPYGEAAKTYLTTLKLYDTLNANKQLVMADNIGQAFQFTNTGHVDMGFVAFSQIKALEKKEAKEAEQADKGAIRSYQVVSKDEYPAILQDGVVITDKQIATDFSNYLLSEKGQGFFAEAGYLPVTATDAK